MMRTARITIMNVFATLFHLLKINRMHSRPLAHLNCLTWRLTEHRPAALSISLAAASDSLHVLSVRHVEVERVSLLILQIEAHFEEVTVILRVLILFASFLAR